MTDRPQVPNWKNNSSKPEEYSSEFVVGNLRYANVTNASTGQRQLYLVSGLGGTVLTQRSLLSSTNSNGNVTKGEGYDSFVKQFGVDTLKKAEDTNKQQSVKLLTTPGISTETESKSIKDSKEFKSTAAGNNSAKTTQQEAQSSLADLSSKETESLSRSSFPQNLRYPENLQIDQQDVIKFNMVKYKARDFKSGEGTINPIQNRRSITDELIIGSVYLPIPGGITDTNAVTWGSDSMDPIQSALANIALASIGGGGDAGASAAGETATDISKNAKDAKSWVQSYFAQAATGTTNLLSRTQGAVTNPNMELLFSAPTLRPFSFTFKLSARGTKDRDQIRQIIRFFKQGMAVQRTASQLFLKAPHTFKIQYLHKDASSGKMKDHPYINQIKECALQSFTVNYTPEQTYMTFADGLMTSYEITMQFQELEPIFNDDYSKLDKDNDSVIGY